jgi:predicted transposase/invertase (TIGR01784 family)
MDVPKTRLRVLNDFAFKKVLGERGDEPQLIAFLNAVLNREGEDRITSVEIVENKEFPPDFLGGKTSRLDVIAVIADKTVVNIEIQLKNEYNMDKRSLRHWALEYSRGILEGQNYIDLPPVIVINILDFSFIPLDDFHTSFHIYEDNHKEYMLTNALEMHYIEVVKWRKLKDKDYTNALHRWMAYFDEKSPPELIEEVAKMDMAIQTVQNKLEKVRNDPDFAHAYNMYEETLIDYKFGMQGARQDGKREGKLEGKLEVASEMKKCGVPIAQITQYTGLPPDEIAKL